MLSCLLLIDLYGSVALASLHLLQQHVMLARLVASSCLATGKLSMYHTQSPVSTAATWPHHDGDATVLQDAIIGLCSGPDALFTLGALCEATTGFLTHLPQDSRGPPVEGLTWVSSGACVNILHKQSLTRSVKWFLWTCIFELSLALTCA